MKSNAFFLLTAIQGARNDWGIDGFKPRDEDTKSG